MQSDIKIAVVGGDMRQVVMAEALAGRGYEVAVYGFDSSPEPLEHTTRCTKLDCAICGADLVILPLPYSHDKIHINCPLSKKEIHLSDFFEMTLKMNGSLIMGGVFDCVAEDYSKQYNIKLCDYYEREELTIHNAIPTAEAAISIAMQEMPSVLDSSEALVLGFGRIGKLLALKLRALGARVCVAARKKEDLAWIRALGCTPVEYSALDERLELSNTIFNTVPALILDEHKLSRVNKSAVIVDLASKPGGVDRSAAKRLGINVVWALSLPGKFAPVTSGLMLSDCVLNICREEGLV